MHTANLMTPDLAQHHYINPFLSHLEWSVASPRVLSIGADAVYEAYCYLETYGFSRLQIDCVDLVPSPTAYVPLPHHDFGAQVRWEKLDLAQVAPQRQYHLIWSSELFDAMDDALCKRMLSHLLQAGAPGSELVLGSHTSSSRLQDLASACGVPTTALSTRRGPDGRKYFLHIKQTRPAPDWSYCGDAVIGLN